MKCLHFLNKNMDNLTKLIALLNEKAIDVYKNVKCENLSK